jgi:hypothetical protein
MSTVYLEGRSISDNVFRNITNLNITVENFSKINILDNVKILKFDVSNFKGNVFSSTMKMMFGTVSSMNANNISDVSKISLNGNMISDNIFNNCTICNIDALTFSVNNFSGIVKMMNMTGEAINGNTAACSQANIKVMTFNNNSMNVSGLLDLKADTIASNTLYAYQLNGVFDGQSNYITAQTALLSGLLLSNEINLIHGGRIDGQLVDNRIYGTYAEYDDITETLGTITINGEKNYDNTNIVSCFDEVYINDKRGPFIFSEINKLYIDNITPLDTFYKIKSIFYRGTNNPLSATYYSVSNIYSEVISRIGGSG